MIYLCANVGKQNIQAEAKRQKKTSMSVEIRGYGMIRISANCAVFGI